MKRTSIIALFIPFLFMGCENKCIEDSGNHVSRAITLKNFDKIKVEGAIKLVMTQDSSYKVQVEADSNIITYVKADVSGAELRLKLDYDRYCGTDSIIIHAGIGELKGLQLDGAVKVMGEGRIYAADVDLSFSGASDVRLDLSAAKVTTKVDGVGKIALSGQAGTHDLKIKGTAKVNAFDFIVGVYNIDTEGTGKAEINVLNELKVKTSGSSEIYYKGNPKKVDEKKSGATKLEKVN
ncbi:head GIN domain-containing protein [Pedobacter africanus]|uniref:Putative auto-transporter adhesin, head GIN domain n=1 Tax=Pedobacter africanus TaxID=151894 RepID=A0A1W2DDI3_9SPHI|nr:head GIN domain-containing protein [Pedobacter africanus]SMC95609.1 Putative auto-transporter adhesin, head GIN domain [Pedobacter africanus]